MQAAVADSNPTTPISFLLHGKQVDLTDFDPQQTVLQWLREEQQLCGTKEGCAEGDCGACTVVLGERDGQHLRLYSVNACIQFLPMLHGKALFTVESLKKMNGGVLHPVQQSMIETHASQCGFCTPGFVMSLFALFKQGTAAGIDEIQQALSGNLCRCTGYRPIVEAGQRMFELESDHWIGRAGIDEQAGSEEKAILEQLDEINRSNPQSIDASGHQYLMPESADAMDELLAEFPEATVVAGNTDVGLWVNKQLRQIPQLVSVMSMRDMRRIDEENGGLRIYAGVSLNQAFAKVCERFPELTDLYHRFASEPVRNAGTLVGNVANGSPIGDSMPALLVLGTRLRIRKKGQSRELPLEQFYLGYQKKDLQPGEWLESIWIPARAEGLKLASYKWSKRRDQDISAVCSAIAVELDQHNEIRQCRIAFGGMAAIPARALHTEQALIGKPLDQQSMQSALPELARDYSPLSDLRATADSRNKVAANLLLRFALLHSDENSPVTLQQVSA